MNTRRTFPPHPASITAARRFVLAAAGEMAKDLQDAVSVMVSELAMNAVQHAQTEFGVQLELTGTDLCVEVSDSCSGNPDLQPRPPASLAHGRGLLLVHRLSDQWGVTRSHTRAGKTVWFRVSLSHHLVTAGT